MYRAVSVIMIAAVFPYIICQLIDSNTSSWYTITTIF